MEAGGWIDGIRCGRGGRRAEEVGGCRLGSLW